MYFEPSHRPEESSEPVPLKNIGRSLTINKNDAPRVGCDCPNGARTPRRRHNEHRTAYRNVIRRIVESAEKSGSNSFKSGLVNNRILTERSAMLVLSLSRAWLRELRTLQVTHEWNHAESATARACCLIWIGLILFIVSSADSRKARAAPIQRFHELAEVDRQSYRTWPEYVLGGPSVWSSIPHPPLTAGIEQAIWRNIRTDPSESNPTVQFFLYRENLAPLRFDHYHPRLALELHRIVAAATTQMATSSVLNAPTTAASDQAQQLGPASQQVPEPAPLVIAFIMAGYALWRRRRA